ncbi:hypothetical protein CGLO_11784 [Colletotrichum gloeosporioides Cg-14]|uniref:Uncharacterized protein n=1 Tax=Colletotrichum gloeosporioides (strain Cg-14) TaxID=1237896 RepID=T0K7J6_COLGC|nr:hypothetical protein CGLO_11784 [Colletotrichum gloeosporioides Cg-14]
MTNKGEEGMHWFQES